MAACGSDSDDVVVSPLDGIWETIVYNYPNYYYRPGTVVAFEKGKFYILSYDDDGTEQRALEGEYTVNTDLNLLYLKSADNFSTV